MSKELKDPLRWELFEPISFKHDYDIISNFERIKRRFLDVYDNYGTASYIFRGEERMKVTYKSSMSEATQNRLATREENIKTEERTCFMMMANLLDTPFRQRAVAHEEYLFAFAAKDCLQFWLIIKQILYRGPSTVLTALRSRYEQLIQGERQNGQMSLTEWRTIFAERYALVDDINWILFKLPPPQLIHGGFAPERRVRK